MTKAASLLPGLLIAQPTLVHGPPQGPGWVHEVKFDGYRIVARATRNEVWLTTRGQKEWSANASGVVASLRALNLSDAVLDGEVMLMRADGSSDFGALRHVKAKRRENAVIYMVFDLLWLNGRDLRGCPLLERRARLRGLLATDEQRTHLKESELFDGDGSAVFRGASGLELEGIVSKRAISPYPSGRTRDWLKTKNANFVRR